MSDFDTSKFGYWDADSASFYSSFEPPYSPQPQLACRSQPFPPSPTLSHHSILARIVPLPASPALSVQAIPPSSPQRSVSTEGQNIQHILEAAQLLDQATPNTSPECSPTPELHYPTPTFISPTVRLVTPELPPILSPSPFYRPPSAPANTPVPRISSVDLQPLIPPTVSPPDSPIDYKAAALRVAYQEREPTPAPPVNQENLPPPAPIIQPPSCINQPGNPHQYILVATPQGEEWRPIKEFYQTTINHLIFTDQLCAQAPTFPGVTPF